MGRHDDGSTRKVTNPDKWIAGWGVIGVGIGAGYASIVHLNPQQIVARAAPQPVAALIAAVGANP